MAKQCFNEALIYPHVTQTALASQICIGKIVTF